LIRVFDHLWKRLQLTSLAETHAVIHGSPHPYNVLLVDGEPRFIDFETTCIGPVEWDLAHTSPDTASSYAGAVDAHLLQTCRDMVRVKTAAWCWADAHRGDLRSHAETHLAHLKEMFAGHV
jgi:thiamine kinase-like enzyme